MAHAATACRIARCQKRDKGGLEGGLKGGRRAGRQASGRHRWGGGRQAGPKK